MHWKHSFLCILSTIYYSHTCLHTLHLKVFPRVISLTTADRKFYDIYKLVFLGNSNEISSDKMSYIKVFFQNKTYFVWVLQDFKMVQKNNNII